MLKDKKLMVFLALAVVFAILITGCGKTKPNSITEDSPYAESAPETNESDIIIESDNITAADEVEDMIGEKPSEDNYLDLLHWCYKRDKYLTYDISPDSNGYYNYTVSDKTVPCKTNIWNYIDVRDGLRGEYYVFRFEDLVLDIGLTPVIYENSAYGAEPSFAFGPGAAADNIYEYKALFIAGLINDTEFNEAIYRFGNTETSWDEATSLNLIIVATYQLEHYALGESRDEVLSFFESWNNGNYYVIP